MSKVPSLKLASGHEMPIVGLGTYARHAEPGQYRQAVEWGIDAGYRHIDTAAIYNNEVEVGQGIAKKIKEGIVKRKDLFVTTKLWNDQHAPENVVPALKESLTRLGLDYVDLYLIHWPVSFDSKGNDASVDYVDTWRGMEQCVELGLARHIGVSNFNEKQLARVLQHSTVKPVTNQIEINPTFTSHSLVEFCKKHSVIPVAYTPLGLISEARPEFAGLDTIKTDPKFEVLVKKYNKTRAQIALRYLTQRGIAVLPKSFTKSRIEENLNIFDFELTAEEIQLVDSFNLNHRCVPGKDWIKLKHFPF